MTLNRNIRRLIFASLLAGGMCARVERGGAAPEFHKDIQPVLEKYCFDCHADGANKGEMALDQFKSDADLLANHDLWWHVLKNLRAGLMPPFKKNQPTDAEKELICQWIKRAVFQADPKNPDPGRVTLRRLNRVEYRHTVHDLIGVDYDTASVFPADDTGHGFDDIADVLTLPPMLLEKYLLAANQIISQAVPMVPKVPREKTIHGDQFVGDGQDHSPNGTALSYYSPAVVTNVFNVDIGGTYQLSVGQKVNEKFVDNVFDYNKCRVIFRVDGNELHREDYAWESSKSYHYDYDVNWSAGAHVVTFELQPLTTNEPVRSLTMQITGVKVSGPMEPQYWVRPKNYERFFPKPTPASAPERRAYARELLGGFARRAFRRPPDERTLDRLANLAESIYSQPGKTFEAGVAQGMIAILASPHFLFLTERAEPAAAGETYPLIDECSLASRLSYFLWSSMPDDELLQLAEAGKLRKNLSAQVDRMLRDPRSHAFVEDFTGQWLRARDIESIPLDPRSVLAREETPDPDKEQTRKRFRELRDKPEEQLTAADREELKQLRASFRRRSDKQPPTELSDAVRHAMRLETEDTFDYVLRQDHSLLELLDSDYTFLNERLAKHYGIPDVSGNEMRLVKLPADRQRGGVLTQGTVLGVTSNPTRTSPVKRGVFILDNILGTPPPPPPPNIPPLENAAAGLTNRVPTLRETLEAHRSNPLCSSCHQRMDPLGLALENYNALGQWRDQELNQPIDAAGQLITGESFANFQELRTILVKKHYKDFYRTVAEKMLIYAVGRGLDYYDVETTDQIVARLEAADGHPSALIAGIVESAPFQRTRTDTQSETVGSAKPRLRADATIKP